MLFAEGWLRKAFADLANELDCPVLVVVKGGPADANGDVVFALLFTNDKMLAVAMDF